MIKYLPLYVLLILCSTGIYSSSYAQSSSSEWILVEGGEKIDVFYKHVVTTGSFVVLKVVNKTTSDIEIELNGVVNYENYPDQVPMKIAGIKLPSSGEIQGNDTEPQKYLDSQLVIDTSTKNDTPFVKLYELKIL